MRGETIISAKNIGIGYAKTKHSEKTSLYNDLSFNLYKGELVCLLGSNGAGKSTLLRTISASQPALNGKILFNNKDITTYSEKELSRLLGLVLTDKTSTGGLLVRELVELGRYPYTGFFGQLTKEDKDIVQKAMEDVCIVHKANVYVAQLSDGERQKAMIAKALAQECPVVLLDEPTAFLDIESRIEIMNLLHNLAMRKEKTILLSTHDIDMALLLADRLWLLSRDHGLKIGVTEDIILSDVLDHFFKGNSITFDRNSGSFLPNRKSDKKVFLNADNYLFHWTKNMIERHGYSVTEDKEDALFSVFVSSKENIRVQTADTSVELNSYEQLAKFL
ncbi:ABC transporter ATP-binding protein [Dysgonomonas sp. Marseille-P4677]|uniref:ABC transporter ATP-binding protein n=1 Tax=Dysgonomonas sp. Marseille-P4677 TaxID=2364790 RepID=UPI0019144F8D|nr:ABC transporter ATP-binding protein [Dysgonomonas sp. Marseille-P4677]MBK5722778.1 ABC transporter ATP-binding protein [Dysgonomonas sp. Marseille-P4677]